MATWFTSDTHINHANIIKYCKRPFLSDGEIDALRSGLDFKVSKSTIEKHDNTILDNIDKVVRPNDTLYILGDFAFGPYEKIKEIRNQIRCKNVILIWGNHDDRCIEDLFQATYDQVLISVHGQKLFLNHYPMLTWDKSHKESSPSWNLFGHVHGAIKVDPLRLQLDVGVDSHNFKPWSFEEIYAAISPKLLEWKKHRATWPSKHSGGMSRDIEKMAL